MPTLTLQPSDATSKDIYIISDLATTNTDGNGNVGIGERNNAVGSIRRTLIQFDLSTLPADAIISSAILSLYLSSNLADNTRTFGVHRLKRAWVPAQATWNIYSTGNNWSTAGGFHADDCEQTNIGSTSIVASPSVGFIDFSLTPTTKTGLDLGNGFLILAQTTELNDYHEFLSSDDATAGNRPKLVITYTVPATSNFFLLF